MLMGEMTSNFSLTKKDLSSFTWFVLVLFVQKIPINEPLFTKNFLYCDFFKFCKLFSQTLDEVQGEVLKYVTVIATPLVLQGEDHPPTWTHAFADFFSVIYFTNFSVICVIP